MYKEYGMMRYTSSCRTFMNLCCIHAGWPPTGATKSGGRRVWWNVLLIEGSRLGGKGVRKHSLHGGASQLLMAGLRKGWQAAVAGGGGE